MKIINRSTFNVEGEILTFEDGSQKLAFNVEDFFQLPTTKLTSLDVIEALKALGIERLFTLKSQKQYTAVYSNNQTRPKAVIYITGKNLLTLSIHKDCLGEESGFNVVTPDARFPSTTRFAIASKAELISLLEAIQEPLRVFLSSHG